mmetsp:Transcript_8580/g.9843  ORF Transcript_8580/g.9843 Transcript_8580/m.9843 type:complete len:146 (-) Transcript_8580:78-515(-)
MKMFADTLVGFCFFRLLLSLPQSSTHTTLSRPKFSFFLVKHTKTVARVYIIDDVIISAFKIGFSAYIVFGLGLDSNGEGHVYPPFAHEILVGDSKFGDVVDKMWMVFNAICPLIISYIRSRHEPALIFTLDIEKRIIEEETISAE